MSFRGFCIALFLANVIVAPAYADPIPKKIPSREEIELRLSALIELNSFKDAEGYDDIDAQRKWLYTLEASPKETLGSPKQKENMKKFEYIMSFSNEMKADKSDLKLADVIKWYENARAATGADDVGFRFWGRVGGHLDRIPERIAQIDSANDVIRKKPNVLENPTPPKADPRYIPTEKPLIRARTFEAVEAFNGINRQPRHIENVERVVNRRAQVFGWVKPEVIDTHRTLDVDNPERGLRGSEVDLPILAELEAHNERINTLKALVNSPELKSINRTKVEEALVEAQNDLKKFQAEIAEMTHNPRNTNALSEFAGANYDWPIDPVVSYMYQPELSPERTFTAQDRANVMQQAQQERDAGIIAAEAERKRVLDTILPSYEIPDPAKPGATIKVAGYNELEERSHEIPKEIEVREAEVDRRNRYSYQDISDRKKIWPMRNAERDAWLKLDAIDHLLGTETKRPQTLNDEEIRTLKEIDPNFKVTTFDRIAVENQRKELLREIPKLVAGNVPQLNGELHALRTEALAGERQMNRLRLGQDLNGIDSTIRKLKAQRADIDAQIAKRKKNFHIYETMPKDSMRKAFQSLDYDVKKLRIHAIWIDKAIVAMETVKGEAKSLANLGKKHFEILQNEKPKPVLHQFVSGAVAGAKGTCASLVQRLSMLMTF